MTLDVNALLAHLAEVWEFNGPATVGIKVAEGDWLEVGTLDLGRLLTELNTGS